jgi:hypothetical protein
MPILFSDFFPGFLRANGLHALLGVGSLEGGAAVAGDERNGADCGGTVTREWGQVRLSCRNMGCIAVRDAGIDDGVEGGRGWVEPGAGGHGRNELRLLHR